MPPQFRTESDAQSGGTWVLDRGHRIAHIRPPRLYDLVLTPGGPPLIQWLTLFWWQYANHELPGRSAWLVDELRLDDHNPEEFRLQLRTHNSDGAVESRCHLRLTQDPTRNAYVYDVALELQVQPGRSWVVEPQGGVEFLNLWCRDAVGPAIPSPHLPPQRWHWVVYRNRDGGLSRAALNHLGGPHLWQIFFAEQNGWLAFMNHPDGNPMVELTPDTARHTRAEVCAWGYDVHFILRTHEEADWQPDPTRLQIPESRHVLSGGQTVQARYRLSAVSAQEGAAWMAQATPAVVEPAVAQRLVRPAYHAGVNTFDEEIRPQVPHTGWYWEPSQADGLSRDQTHGHNDRTSLHIRNAQPRLAFWEVALGPDFWMPALARRPQRLCGWIRTDGCGGPGAYLSFQYSSYDRRTGRLSALPEARTVPLTGTRPGRYVELPVPPPQAEDVSRAYIRLVLEGPGSAWFDDIALLEP
jgi:hypothetical protein